MEVTQVFVASRVCFEELGARSGLVDLIQKMTIAAMQMVNIKVWAHRELRLARACIDVLFEIEVGS